VAVAGNADYLVTNDAHFNEVKNLRFPKVNIISAEGFLDILLQEMNFDPHNLPV
jgi:predicted nucleic acid-binding protein